MNLAAESEPVANAAFIRDLERKRLRSLVEPDVDVARRLHADDYELVPPGGSSISGAGYIGSIEREEFVYDVFEPASEIRCRTYRGAAIVRYHARFSAMAAIGRMEASSGTPTYTSVAMDNGRRSGRRQPASGRSPSRGTQLVGSAGPPRCLWHGARWRNGTGDVTGSR